MPPDEVHQELFNRIAENAKVLTNMDKNYALMALSMSVLADTVSEHIKDHKETLRQVKSNTIGLGFKVFYGVGVAIVTFALAHAFMSPAG